MVLLLLPVHRVSALFRFLSHGIDTAEITMMGRELLDLIGCNITGSWSPAATVSVPAITLECSRMLLGQPSFAAGEASEITGLPIEVPINEKARRFSLSCLRPLLWHSAYYSSRLSDVVPRNRPRLHSERICFGGRQFRSVFFARIDEALNARSTKKRSDWASSGFWRRMRPLWRVFHQYMDTMNGRPISWSHRFRHHWHAFRECSGHARGAHLRVYCRLIHHGKLRLDPVEMIVGMSPTTTPVILRAPWVVGRAAPHPEKRCRNFHEMPENTIASNFCCGSGLGGHG